MSFKTVFIEESIRDLPKVKGIIDRLPDSNSVIINGRLFHKTIRKRMLDIGLPKLRDKMMPDEYGDKCVEALSSEFPDEAIRFVSRIGTTNAGTLNRGEACAFSKSYLFLTSSSTVDTLIKPSARSNRKGKRILCCNYTQLNPISSCPYQCMYCFESDLRGYDFPFMRFYVNYGEIYSVLKKLDQGAFPRTFPASDVNNWFSVNMGEHADSLAQEHIFKILPEVIGWFNDFKNLHLLLLSKGGNADILPDNPPLRRIVMAFSINTKATSSSLEVDAPAPLDRLRELKKAHDKGYMVSLRLDPLVPYPSSWKEEIEDLINLIHKEAPLELQEITIGSMRFRTHQASLFTKMFKSENIRTPTGRLYKNVVNEDVMGFLYGDSQNKEKGFSDGYSRFTFDVRKELYEFVIGLIKSKRPKLRITLCQEQEEMYKSVQGACVPGSCNCMAANYKD